MLRSFLLVVRRWTVPVLVACTALISAGCRHRTIQQYCSLRQDLWEGAYAKERPDFAAQTRNVFVKSCERRFQTPGTDKEFLCRDSCLGDVSPAAPGTQAAKDVFAELLRCEARCPGTYCAAPPTW